MSVAAAWCLHAANAAAGAAVETDTLAELGRLSIEDLANIDVSSVSRSDQPVSDAPVSPSYTELGAQIRWAVSPRLEIALTGANLLHKHHPEFGATTAQVQLGAIGVETGRSVFLDTRWRF